MDGVLAIGLIVSILGLLGVTASMFGVDSRDELGPGGRHHQ